MIGIIVEYLNAREIIDNKDAIQSAFDALMATRLVVCRPRAKQWCFFKACAEHLFGEKRENEVVDSLSKVTAAQYKYEVENKLRFFYQRPGNKHNFVFTMIHANQLSFFGLLVGEYPSIADYCVLVRDMSEQRETHVDYSHAHISYLERVVAEGMAAELKAYLSLPECDITVLDAWFVENGPAMREIKNVIQGVAARGWHLQNDMNPSTNRMLSVVVKEVTVNKAEVATREYWYLRWWDQHRKKYAYPYRETNMQLYILRKIGEKWLIFQNIRPTPRSSQPLRWKRR